MKDLKFEKMVLFFFLPIHLGRLKLDSASSQQIADALIDSGVVEEADWPLSGKNTRNNLLKTLSDVQEEVFSRWYCKPQRFIRFYIGKVLLSSPAGKSLQFEIYFTLFYNDIGCFLLIADLDTSHDVKEIMDFTCRFQGMPVEYRQIEDLTSFDFNILAEAVDDCRERIVEVLRSLNLIMENNSRLVRDFEDIRREIFPFYVLYSTNPKIKNVGEFCSEFLRELYGITYLDYTGWYNTRQENMLKALGNDLSRREDYSLFISKNGATEIESLERLQMIKNWAKGKKVSFEHELLDVVLERAIIIEILLSQRCLLEYLNLILITGSESMTVREEMLMHARMRRESVRMLNEYYNIEVVSKLHVSGVGWIESGKDSLGINRIYEALKERLESLQYSESEVTREQQQRLNTLLVIISFFLSAAASSGFVDLLSEIDFLSLHITNFSWQLKLGFVVLFISIPVLLYLRTYRKVWKD